MNFLIDTWLGMNSREESHKIPNFYLANSKNLDQSSIGSISPSKQYSLFGDRQTGEGKILSSYTYVKIDGIQIPLRTRDDNSYTYLEWYNATALEWEILVTQLTTAKPIVFASFNKTQLTPVPKDDNKIYFCNGVMNLSFWNGAIGTVASNTATTITLNETPSTQGFNSAGGTVIVNGTEYTYSGYTDGSKRLDGLTGLPTFDANEGVAEKADTTTLSASPKLKMMVVADRRIWGVVDNSVRMYASKIGDGTGWTASATPSDSLAVDFPEGTGPITAISNIRDTILIFKKDIRIGYKLSYSADQTTVVNTIETLGEGIDAGAAYHLGVTKAGDMVYYVTRKGGVKAVTLNTTNDKLTSLDITDKIRPTLIDGVYTSSALAYSERHKKLLVSFKKDSNSSLNDTLVVVDHIMVEGNLQHRSLGIYDWFVNSWFEYNDDLYFGSSAEPNTFKAFDGYIRDSEYPFTALATLKRYNFTSDTKQKSVKYIMVQGFIPPGGLLKFEAEYDAGGSRAFLTSQFDTLNDSDKKFIIEPKQNLLGSFEYGSEPLGGTMEDIEELNYFKFFFVMPEKHHPYELTLNIYSDGADSNKEIIGNKWKIEKVLFVAEDAQMSVDSYLKKNFI